MDSLWGKFKRRGAIATPDSKWVVVALRSSVCSFATHFASLRSFLISLLVSKCSLWLLPQLAQLRFKIGHYNQSQIWIFLKRGTPLSVYGTPNSFTLIFDLDRQCFWKTLKNFKKIFSYSQHSWSLHSLS